MRYLFILILVSVAFVVSCQETAFEDLPEIVSPSGTDEFTMYRSGAPYRESYSTAYAPVVDSLQDHRDSINNYSSYFTAIDLDILSLQVLVSAAFDSINWLADTSRAHNVRLLDLESGGGGLLTASNGLTAAGSDVQLGGALTGTTDITGNFRLNIGETVTPLSLIEITSLTGSSIGLSNGAADQKYINITDAAMTVFDTQDSKGLYYAADYSGTATGRWLVDKDYADGVVGGGYWSRSTTDLSPTTSGDDILLNGSGERILFDDVNTSIYWTGGTMFFTSTNNLHSFSGSIFHSADIYGSDNVSDLGDPAAFYADLYANNHFIEETDTEIGRDGSGNMTFEDAVTSQKTLAELANSTDTIEIAVFTANTVAGGDIIGSFYHDGTDTLFIEEMVAIVQGSTPSVTFDIQWHATFNSASATGLFVTPPAITNTTTGAKYWWDSGIGDFDNTWIPPGRFVFCEISATSGTVTYANVTILGYRRNNQW